MSVLVYTYLNAIRKVIITDNLYLALSNLSQKNEFIANYLEQHILLIMQI